MSERPIESSAHPSPGSAAVPDVVAPPPRHPRFPLFDGLRAVAALTVLAVHVAVFAEAVNGSLGGRLLAHLNIGVTIFFLISGFLLYRPFIAWRTGGAQAPALRRYATNRALRIFPAYWLLLAVLAAIPGITGAGGDWLLHLGLVQTLPLGEPGSCTGAAILDCGVAQTWSLAVELTFYAALPLYVLGAAGLARGGDVGRWMRSELALLGVLAAASVLFAFGISDETVPRSWAGGTLLGYMAWFALGMGLAVLSVGFQGRPPPRVLRGLVLERPALAWTAALALYVAFALLVPPTPFLLATGDRLLGHLAFGAIAALLVLPAVFDAPAGGLPRRFLTTPVVAWLGLISYGIFLWHYVFALELGTGGAGRSFPVVLVGTLAGSIACAAASYYALERPMLRLKSHSLRGLLSRPGRRRQAAR